MSEPSLTFKTNNKHLKEGLEMSHKNRLYLLDEHGNMREVYQVMDTSKNDNYTGKVTIKLAFHDIEKPISSISSIELEAKGIFNEGDQG